MVTSVVVIVLDFNREISLLILSCAVHLFFSVPRSEKFLECALVFSLTGAPPGTQSTHSLSWSLSIRWLLCVLVSSPVVSFSLWDLLLCSARSLKQIPCARLRLLVIFLWGLRQLSSASISYRRAVRFWPWFLLALASIPSVLWRCCPSCLFQSLQCLLMPVSAWSGLASARSLPLDSRRSRFGPPPVCSPSS
jgi:hypothetical protein